MIRQNQKENITTATNMNLTDPALQHEAPLVHLVKQNPADMSEEELKSYVNDMRLLRSSAQTQKAAVKGKAPEASKIQQLVSKFL